MGYDWTEEWYPLYLAKDVPEDAPLGLTVFDKQVVLYRDGNGELKCYEDPGNLIPGAYKHSLLHIHLQISA